MFFTSKRMLLLLLTILSLAVVSCGTGSVASSQSACNKTSSIKGSIQTISPASGTTMLGTFLLDGTKEQQATYDSVSVVFDPNTQIFQQHGQECRKVTFSALQANMRVQVQANGPATQSYPPEITATEVVILDKQ